MTLLTSSCILTLSVIVLQKPVRTATLKGLLREPFRHIGKFSELPYITKHGCAARGEEYYAKAYRARVESRIRDSIYMHTVYGRKQMKEKKTKAKPFMTYEQQIHKLKNEKKLEITDEDAAKDLLKKHSYFALISGYKQPFKDKKGFYKQHVSIEDIYKLYVFDDRLRALVLQYTLKIERHVKSLISYSFCQAYGEEQQHYLNATKYNYNAENQEEINELISRLTKIITDPNNYPYIRHQKRNMGMFHCGL